jgi:hypothetical protein
VRGRVLHDCREAEEGEEKQKNKLVSKLVRHCVIVLTIGGLQRAIMMT